ncbi:hypothetical protein [Chryseobacterium sp. R2A-55]|uniref:hypothetical protein n=1 Tax=Chryseobacterium sp. R2A-55 TaxID=2744445 RepID=UPI001F2A7C3F|nr:hypothetical protein [Chryseobacterium sp. R2A-55]
MKIRVFQIQKKASETFAEIQDKYLINPALRTVALCDGATQGFRSEIWAEMLVQAFTTSPNFKKNDLIEFFTTKAEEFDDIRFEFNENFAVKAIEKKKRELGSFSTFMGVQIDGIKVQFISSGDVCSFVVKNGKIFSSYPFTSVEQLDADQGFLGTKKLIRNEISEDTFYEKNVEIQRDCKLLLVTDAIARYILRTKDIEILNVQNFADFKNYILNIWEDRLLEDDDISLIEVSEFDNADFVIEEILPPEDFSFPKENPASTKNFNLQYMKEIKELQNQIEFLKRNVDTSEKRIDRISSKLKSLGYILFSILGLMALSAIIFFWQSFNSKRLAGEEDAKVKQTNLLEVQDSEKSASIKSKNNVKQANKKNDEVLIDLKQEDSAKK